MKYILLLLLLLLLFVLIIEVKYSFGSGVDKNVTVDVFVFDDGQPLKEASVRGGFEQQFDWDRGVSMFAITDTNGYAQVSEKCSNGFCLRINKDSYYQHIEDWKLYSLILEGSVLTNCTVELKKIKNPVPMYVKQENREIPNTEDFFGYDFEVGDWVAPHGEGKVSDILFKPKFTSSDRYNYSVELEVKFPGEYNGIQPMPRKYQERQGSQLRSSHQAPEAGYVDYLNMSRFRKDEIVDDGDFSEKDREGYYYRIRSEVDMQGNLISAQYGKIYGSFDLYGGILGKELGLAFFYYFNPDKTRNVEFDPKRNLFLKQPEGGFLPLGRAKLEYSITAP